MTREQPTRRHVLDLIARSTGRPTGIFCFLGKCTADLIYRGVVADHKSGWIGSISIEAESHDAESAQLIPYGHDFGQEFGRNMPSAAVRGRGRQGELGNPADPAPCPAVADGIVPTGLSA